MGVDRRRSARRRQGSSARSATAVSGFVAAQAAHRVTVGARFCGRWARRSVAYEGLDALAGAGAFSDDS